MPNLPKRTLGRTGLEVTTLGFGAMELRSGVSDTDAAALLNAVLDGGINFIDTSIDYGASEAHIGKHIANRRDEGKVRFVGVSGTLPNLVEQIGMDCFDAFQIPYSALQRDHEDVIAQASEAGAGIIIRGGVARGAPEDWRGRRYYMVDANTLQSRWDEAKLDDLLNGMSRVEWTLRFTLSDPHLDTTIVGTKNLDHLRGNIETAMKGALPEDVVAEAKRRLGEAGSMPMLII